MTLEMALNALIRPERFNYDLSGIDPMMSVDDSPAFITHPLRIKNKRGHLIYGTLYQLLGSEPFKCTKCVMYLHGNASCQLEGQFLVPNIGSHDVLVCCIDFAGCGHSEGPYVSLGYYEKEDVEYVMTQLHNSFKIDEFILWGRSMGAATAVMVRHEFLKGIVVDSCYSTVSELCAEIAKTKVQLSDWILSGAIWGMSWLVQYYGSFDLYKIKPIEDAKTATVPALFGHAPLDQFVPFSLGNAVFEAYACDEKEMIRLPGGHNSKRTESWIRAGVEFCLKTLGIKYDKDSLPFYPQRRLETFHYESFNLLVQGERT